MVAANTPPKKSALAFMERLSPSVSYYVPEKVVESKPKSNADPELIILLSWMGAKEDYIAKYVEGHRALFPTSRILVAQCPLAHVFFPWLGVLQIKPAVPILKELVPKKPGQETSGPPKILLHAFSNGGVSTALHLFAHLKRQLGGKLVLPRRAFIFDSCPGKFNWRGTAHALSSIMPRLATPLIYSVLALIWLIYRIPYTIPAQNRNCRAIRNPAHAEGETRRTYIYSAVDAMIPWQAVEQEAREARRAGFNVRLERFDKAQHCAIAKVDPDRYWGHVKDTWYGPPPR